MAGPTEIFNYIKKKITPQAKLAFVAAFVMGLLIHMPIMLQDIPNHDGLDSVYFDQNMITSGRWFLTIACGISSYYTLPWLIGLLAMGYLGLTAMVLTEFLELRQSWAIVLVSGLLVSFPSLASTFAYVFTMDGYMMAVLLAVLAVLLTKKYKWGFVPGGVCLAFSMGIYQAYLSVAVLLCIYGILMTAMEQGRVKEKLLRSLKYLYMGLIGVGGYYIILQILLKIQGKELADYQGINEMGTVGGSTLADTLKQMYSDFFAFTLNGNVLVNNGYSLMAALLLAVLAVIVLVLLAVKEKWFKNPWFYVLLVLLAVGLPIATNMILFISPQVTYHALMRYQWVLYPILLVAFMENGCRKLAGEGTTAAETGVEAQVKPQSVAETGVEAVAKSQPAVEATGDKAYAGRLSFAQWLTLLAAGVLVWNFAVTDNIAYGNLQKKYEKTYSYCVRLLDRIEQTPGYYQGIPIAMIGVVGDEAYPVTDVTGEVTSNLIGTGGDYLLYTGQNYKLFIEHYLGASLNILPAEAMEEMYYSDVYVQMNSFPAQDSIQIIDGVMYIKTENIDKGLAEE